MRKIFLTIGVVAALSVLAAACNHAEDGGSDDFIVESGATPTTAAGTSSPSNVNCDSATLESSETGISSSEITLLVMADVGSPLAPGLFQGSIDGTNAWVNYINASGGLACRRINLVEHDSAINPNETTNGYLRACDEALTMVGSTALFVIQTETLNSCDDKAGNPTGLPEFPERTIEAGHACSPNVFSVSGNTSSCPNTPGTPQPYRSNIGMQQWFVENFGGDEGLHGVFLIPADTPSSTLASMSSLRLINRVVGIKNDGEFGVSGRAPQATYGQYISKMRSEGSNYARTGLNDDSMLKWRREAVAQGGFDNDIIWSCSLACYSSSLRNDAAAEGTYVWMSFLPYEEKAHNVELNTFITAIENENPPAWAAGAWAAGRLFQQVVEAVVAEFGVNGITRARILAEANKVTSFTANGWFGVVDFTTKAQGNASRCFVGLQVQNGEFVRVHPQEPGSLDCNPDNIGQITIDPSQEFDNGPSPQDIS